MGFLPRITLRPLERSFEENKNEVSVSDTFRKEKPVALNISKMLMIALSFIRENIIFNGVVKYSFENFSVRRKQKSA